MAIPISLEDHHGNVLHRAKIAEYAPVSKFLPVLIKLLRLPIIDDAGRPIVYHLSHGGRSLQEDETLAEVDVQAGDTLVLVPEVTQDRDPEQPDRSQVVKIFFCYAHKDERLLKRLQEHLNPLRREGLVDVWYDRNISAGTEWEREIKAQLNTADIILLLVSPDFINSEFCYNVEVKQAVDRHERGEVRVIPVILRRTFWEGTPFGKLQALPRDGKPVTGPGWHNQDEALFDVAQSIKKVAKQLREH